MRIGTDVAVPDGRKVRTHSNKEGYLRAIEMLAKAEGFARSTLMYGSASRFIVAYPAGSGVGERLARLWDGLGHEPRLRPWHPAAMPTGQSYAGKTFRARIGKRGAA